jgi:hypothetical protein
MVEEGDLAEGTASRAVLTAVVSVNGASAEGAAGDADAVTAVGRSNDQVWFAGPSPLPSRTTNISSWPWASL